MLLAIGKGIRDEKSMVLKFLKQYICLINCGINQSWQIKLRQLLRWQNFWSVKHILCHGHRWSFPDILQKQVFPFCEDALARLPVHGCQNQGTINFLKHLQHLWPFWRVWHGFFMLICAVCWIHPFRQLVQYVNNFQTQASSSDWVFYLSLTLNHFFSNGWCCASKKRLQMINCQFSEMHFMRVQLIICSPNEGNEPTYGINIWTVVCAYTTNRAFLSIKIQLTAPFNSSSFLLASYFTL